MRAHCRERTSRFIPALILCAGAITVCALLVGTFAQPTEAQAVTSAEKRAEADAVYAQIDSLQTSLNEAVAKLEAAQGAYDEAIELRDEAAKQIEVETARIEQLQDELSSFARGMYKQGGSESFIDVILDASTFADFVTSWDACNAITQQGMNKIEEAKNARAQLEAAKATYEEQSQRAQEELQSAEQTKIQIEETQEALRVEAENLSAEAAQLQVQEELAAEAARQAEEARKQREAEIAAAAEAAAAAGASGGGDGYVAAQAGGSVAMGSGYFCTPCPAATNSSGFGYRDFDGAFHKGLDMAAPTGTPYYAADNGTVMYATYDGGYNGGAGNWVVISHGNGIVTKYMHSSAVYVSVGQQVTRGQNIGAVGNTGASFGAHLHFQVEVDGVAVNPLNYI